MDIEGVRIRFLRLKVDKTRPFFVWGPFSEAIISDNPNGLSNFHARQMKDGSFLLNKTRFNFENRLTGTIRLLSLKTSCWSCV